MLRPVNCRYSNNSTFKQTSFNMKITRKKVRIQSPLINPIIDLERLLEKVLKKVEYIAIKGLNTPGDNDSGSYDINLPSYGGGSS